MTCSTDHSSSWRSDFTDQFVNLVEAMHTGSIAASLVNKQLSSEWAVVSGIHQSCPLTPLLFVIAAETLMLAVDQHNDTINQVGLHSPGFGGRVTCRLWPSASATEQHHTLSRDIGWNERQSQLGIQTGESEGEAGLAVAGPTRWRGGVALKRIVRTENRFIQSLSHRHQHLGFTPHYNDSDREQRVLSVPTLTIAPLTFVATTALTTRGWIATYRSVDRHTPGRVARVFYDAFSHGKLASFTMFSIALISPLASRSIYHFTFSTSLPNASGSSEIIVQDFALFTWWEGEGMDQHQPCRARLPHINEHGGGSQPTWELTDARNSLRSPVVSTWLQRKDD